MNWLKKLWNWLVRKTSTAPKLAVVEEIEEETINVGDIFRAICLTAGIRHRDLKDTNVVELFEDWYSGAPTEEEVRLSIAEFKSSYPAINAKLNGKL